MTFTDDVALGVKVFKRTDKLEDLFDSIEESQLEKVYVADDGETEEREHLYSSDKYTFTLEVIDLEYDAGLGYGRQQIVEQLEEKYLLIVDSDHTLPSNLEELYTILQSDESIGGVSGLILEHGFLKGMCHDIYIEGDYLYRDVRESKSQETVGESTFVEFEFIPNAALFRAEVFDDYVWDEEFVIGGEHLDFYIGHLETDWRFGVCPEVLFNHNPGGSTEYLQNRGNPFKVESSETYLQDKWDLQAIIPRDFWLNHAYIKGPLPEDVTQKFPPWLFSIISDLNMQVWKFKFKFF